MDKELNKTLSQVMMYSKIGKYISNKILKYNRSSTRKPQRPPTPPYDYLSKSTSKQSIKQEQLKSSNGMKQTGFLRNSLNVNNEASPQRASQNVRTNQSSTHSLKLQSACIDSSPPVGYYKLNYKQIQRNPKTYDFKRSIPHFYQQNRIANQMTPFYKQIPDKMLFRQTGFTELKRMAGRGDIKGCQRKFPQNPHQKRFILNNEEIQNNFQKSLPNFGKMLGRDQIVHNGESKSFRKNKLSSPDYQCNFQISKQRLDTHVLPFEKYSTRNGKYFYSPKGISNSFSSDYNKFNFENRIQNWKKSLPRQKNGILPSYLDKTISSRTALGGINLKSLQMNCSVIKKIKQKPRKALRQQQKENDCCRQRLQI